MKNIKKKKNLLLFGGEIQNLGGGGEFPPLKALKKTLTRMIPKHLSITPNFETSQLTNIAAQISRVWTPPISSTHSSHPPLWHQTWVTPVNHL